MKKCFLYEISVYVDNELVFVGRFKRKKDAKKFYNYARACPDVTKLTFFES